ncbi:hypothetical protein SAMN06298210_10765 [Prevotellaceae bacterium KH2P17]|nr:hypothetical protein SAMN06298210_10765 [Prevotellaceae bacterium KH2P17]
MPLFDDKYRLKISENKQKQKKSGLFYEKKLFAPLFYAV